MSKGFSSYRIYNQNAPHFLTITVEDWVDIFTRKAYRDIIVESLRYCQKEKGLELFAYVLMSNHLHLVARATEPHQLSDILRDFKKYTSRRLIKAMQEEGESRREWLLKHFAAAAWKTSKNEDYKIWRNDNHPIELQQANITQEKINYIHQNPVRAGIVQHPEDYLYSSARNYAGLSYELEIIEP